MSILQSAVVRSRCVQPVRFNVFDILGWTQGLTDDGSVVDVLEFVEMACGDVLKTNHGWLQEQERSTRRIREDLFGIWYWSRFCDPRLWDIINRAMQEEGYPWRGGTLNRVWCPQAY